MLTAKRLYLSCASLLFFIFLALLASLKMGAVHVDWKEILSFQSDIVSKLRLPRILLSLLVGAGLSLSGSVFQALLRNPLADPFVLGISSGSAVGATLAIVLGMTGLQPIFAFGGALTTIFIVLSMFFISFPMMNIFIFSFLHNMPCHQPSFSLYYLTSIVYPFLFYVLYSLISIHKIF